MKAVTSDIVECRVIIVHLDTKIVFKIYFKALYIYIYINKINPRALMWTCSKAAGCDNLLFLDRLCSRFMPCVHATGSSATRIKCVTKVREWSILKENHRDSESCHRKCVYTEIAVCLKCFIWIHATWRVTPGAAAVLTIRFDNWVCFSRLCNRLRRNAVTMLSKHVSPCSSLFGSPSFVGKVIP